MRIGPTNATLPFSATAVAYSGPAPQRSHQGRMGVFLTNPDASAGGGRGGCRVEQFMGLLLHQLQQGPQAGGQLKFGLAQQARQARG